MPKDELDELQDKLVDETAEETRRKMVLDNRSIFTIKDQIIKKAKAVTEKKDPSA